jgi:hypothetical protein
MNKALDCLIMTYTIPVGVVGLVIGGIAIGFVELAMSPLTIPCYFYRKRKLRRWLTQWKNSFENPTEADSVNIESVIDNYKSTFGLANLRYPNSSFPSKDRLFNCLNDELQQSRILFGQPVLDSDPEPVVLRTVTTIKVEENRLRELMLAKNDTCVICKSDEEPMNTDNCYITPCCHIFHRDCLSVWATRSTTCPECRTDII